MWVEKTMTDRIAVTDELAQLLDDVRRCRYCQDLPLGPNPVVRVGGSARILVIGQAGRVSSHAILLHWASVRIGRLGWNQRTTSYLADTWSSSGRWRAERRLI